MQDGVLNPTDVVVYRHPAVNRGLREGHLVVMRIAIAYVIPAGARKRIHRVGHAARRPTAFRAGRLIEVRVFGERLSRPEIQVVREDDRQLVIGYRNIAAVVAMDHGDGVAPVALA